MKFRAAFAEIIGVPELGDSSSNDPATWPALTTRIAGAIEGATRDEWMERMRGKETCCSPVLDLKEAPLHPHNQARSGFVRDGNGWIPAAAPRFSLTPGGTNGARSVEDVLAEFAAALPFQPGGPRSIPDPRRA
jgi:alpha-methylacyl-CoA racemase